MKLNEHDFFSILYFTFFALFFSDLVYSDRVQLFLNWFRCLLVPLKRPPPHPHQIGVRWRVAALEPRLPGAHGRHSERPRFSNDGPMGFLDVFGGLELT